jgi:hypothetical protein
MGVVGRLARNCQTGYRRFAACPVDDDVREHPNFTSTAEVGRHGWACRDATPWGLQGRGEWSRALEWLHRQKEVSQP